MHMPAGVKWLVLSLLCCLLSVLSKEQGITAIAVCITYDIFIFHQVRINTILRCGAAHH